MRGSTTNETFSGAAPGCLKIPYADWSAKEQLEHCSWQEGIDKGGREDQVPSLDARSEMNEWSNYCMKQKLFLKNQILYIWVKY